MKSLNKKSFAIVLLGSLFFAAMPDAAEAAKATKKKNGAAATSAGRGKALKANSGRQLSREFVFDGSDVNGRYHLANGAVAKVEQEKKMISLIGLRGDFKDRLAEERERLKRAEAGTGQ